MIKIKKVIKPKKIKTEIKTEIVNPVKEQLTGLLKSRVYKLFDREPNGSIQSGQLAQLVEEIIKLK
jgi:hypothetical protein